MGKKIKVVVGDSRNYQLVIWVFVLMILLYSLKLLTGQLGILPYLGKLLIVSVFWSLIYRSVKNLNYSFWSFASCFLLFLSGELAFDLLEDHLNTQLTIIYCFIYALFLVILNNLLTPIYYPFIRWWKPKSSSLPINVVKRNREVISGRVVDIRRKSAALILFDSLNVGERVCVEKYPNRLTKGVWARVVTKRDYAFGRGYCLGVKFELEAGDGVNAYQNLKRTWSDKF